MRVATMIIGMYSITFTLFLVETGSVEKALVFGFLASLLKSAFSFGHAAAWARVGSARRNTT
jgi:uncharacterized membrane protein